MKDDTKLVHLGRNDVAPEATVNVPVHRASTIVSPTVNDYLHRFDNQRRYEKVTYGATGTQNSRKLAEAVAELEGGGECVVTSSGLSACTVATGALVKQGDHVLVTDSVYGPTRRYCSEVLTRFGVQTEYFDPSIGGEIRSLLRPNTSLVYTEAPGSLTFEMQDISAIATAAKEMGALVAMDNTWATPLYFRPLDHGVDVSIQAGTKYIAGHSDLVIGMISTRNRDLHHRIADYAFTLGDVAGPDDCYMALRGLRTMGVRIRQQFDSAMKIAAWLETHPRVKRVLYPPLPSDPGHVLWKSQFGGGGASLFGLILDTDNTDAIGRMIDGLECFSIGSSWGGFESLAAVNLMPLARDVRPFDECKTLLRLHVGLEDANDLIADLDSGLERLQL